MIDFSGECAEGLEIIAKEVAGNVIAAYEELTKLLGKPIPLGSVRDALRETLHIAVHELAHAALRAISPELVDIIHSDEVLGECFDEVASRILELIVSERLGIRTHTVEEHLYELKHYTGMANLPLDADELGELYEEALKTVEAGRVRDAVNLALLKCREWAERA